MELIRRIDRPDFSEVCCHLLVVMVYMFNDVYLAHEWHVPNLLIFIDVCFYNSIDN